jgi:hypothetical protein
MLATNISSTTPPVNMYAVSRPMAAASQPQREKKNVVYQAREAKRGETAIKSSVATSCFEKGIPVNLAKFGRGIAIRNKKHNKKF